MEPTGRGIIYPQFKQSAVKKTFENPQNAAFLNAIIRNDMTAIDHWIDDCFWSKEPVPGTFPILLSLTLGKVDIAKKLYHGGLRLTAADMVYAEQKLCVQNPQALCFIHTIKTPPTPSTDTNIQAEENFVALLRDAVQKIARDGAVLPKEILLLIPEADRFLPVRKKATFK